MSAVPQGLILNVSQLSASSAAFLESVASSPIDLCTNPRYIPSCVSRNVVPLMRNLFPPEKMENGNYLDLLCRPSGKCSTTLTLTIESVGVSNNHIQYKGFWGACGKIHILNVYYFNIKF